LHGWGQRGFGQQPVRQVAQPLAIMSKPSKVPANDSRCIANSSSALVTVGGFVPVVIDITIARVPPIIPNDTNASTLLGEQSARFYIR
jgi:hypothetical protein